MRVQAQQVGFYGGITRNLGDVFDIVDADYADSTVDYHANPNNVQLQGYLFQVGPLWGWMLKVPASTPLFTNAPTPVNAKNLPRLVL